MSSLIAWCGFLGAWLLVAGPVYQAAVELGDEDAQRDRVGALSAAVTPPPPVSRWWWLLPPVAYLKERRLHRRFRREVFDALGPEQVAALVSYVHKATGWLLVGSGGLLLAVKETWELHEREGWPIWLFWVLVVVVPVLAAANAAVRVQRGRAVLGSAAARS